jgi:hypothetical protein
MEKSNRSVCFKPKTDKFSFDFIAWLFGGNRTDRSSTQRRRKIRSPRAAPCSASTRAGAAWRDTAAPCKPSQDPRAAAAAAPPSHPLLSEARDPGSATPARAATTASHQPAAATPARRSRMLGVEIAQAPRKTSCAFLGPPVDSPSI